MCPQSTFCDNRKTVCFTVYHSVHQMNLVKVIPWTRERRCMEFLPCESPCSCESERPCAIMWTDSDTLPHVSSRRVAFTTGESAEISHRWCNTCGTYIGYLLVCTVRLSIWL